MMNNEVFYFKPYKQFGLDGFYIPVRNSFNHKLEQEFIPSEAKESYEKKFGQTIITDQEFLDWYAKYVEGNFRARN